jgi:hypothetical protein
LGARSHLAFINGLQEALEGAETLHHDYLSALGGEGLYVSLHEAANPDILGMYASLLLAGKICVPASVVMALNERVPSADLIALADHLMAESDRADTPQSSQPSSAQALPEEIPITPLVQVKRVVQLIDMGFGTYSASDALGLKRSVFRSAQEKTFLQALSLRFPALNAFPNYPLDQLADFSKLARLLDAETLRFGRNCRIDAVLVVPGEGDPVAAFELDSRLHDNPAQQRNDRLKDKLFQTIRIPFFRLRTDDTLSIGVDEWYALLTDEVADKIDCGRRLRVRTSHPTLIPIT